MAEYWGVRPVRGFFYLRMEFSSLMCCLASTAPLTVYLKICRTIYGLVPIKVFSSYTVAVRLLINCSTIVASFHYRKMIRVIFALVHSVIQLLSYFAKVPKEIN